MPRQQQGSGQLGESKTLANGAVGQYTLNATGKKVFRIVSGATDGMVAARAGRGAGRPAVSQAAAQKAFDAYYKRTRKVSRGPRKGQPVYKSPRGRKAARTYDLGHTSQSVVGSTLYTARHGPRLHDYTGVDTGTKTRAPSSAAQQAALAAGRAALAAARQGGGRQQQGGGCRLNPASGRCRKHEGPDGDGCMQGPNKCRLAKNLTKAYAPKRQATPKQLAALAKARAARAAKKSGGAYYWADDGTMKMVRH